MASNQSAPCFQLPPSPVSILDDAAIGNLFLQRIPRLPIRGLSAADALPCRCECTGHRPFVSESGTRVQLPRRFGSSSVSILLQGSGGTLRDGTDVSAPLVMTFDVRPHNLVPSLSSSTTSLQVLQGSGPSTCSTSRPQVPAPRDSSRQLCRSFKHASVASSVAFFSTASCRRRWQPVVHTGAHAVGISTLTMTGALLLGASACRRPLPSRSKRKLATIRHMSCAQVAHIHSACPPQPAFPPVAKNIARGLHDPPQELLADVRNVSDNCVLSSLLSPSPF
jgi:hypothetical protein